MSVDRGRPVGFVGSLGMRWRARGGVSDLTNYRPRFAPGEPGCSSRKLPLLVPLRLSVALGAQAFRSLARPVGERFFRLPAAHERLLEFRPRYRQIGDEIGVQ